jgi:hypothetical protein
MVTIFNHIGMELKPLIFVGEVFDMSVRSLGENLVDFFILSFQ